MNGQVSKSLPRFEDIPHYGSFTESVHVGRGVVFVLSSDLTCHEFSIDKGGRKSVKACVLYKKSAEGSGRTISTNKKTSFHANHGFQEANALLPSSCNQCHDGPSAQESHEQVGSRRTTNPIGY